MKISNTYVKNQERQCHTIISCLISKRYLDKDRDRDKERETETKSDRQRDR